MTRFKWLVSKYPDLLQKTPDIENSYPVRPEDDSLYKKEKLLGTKSQSSFSYFRPAIRATR